MKLWHKRKYLVVLFVFLMVVLLASFFRKPLVNVFRTGTGNGESTEELERDIEYSSDGRYNRLRGDAAGQKSSDIADEKLSELLALPYLQGYRKAPERSSVTVNDPVSAYTGINLYNSGHGPEAFAMNMKGTVLHKWRFDITDIWPDAIHTKHSAFWRRVFWYPNGDILAIFEGVGMIKLDLDSNLLWSFRGGCHHEAYVTKEGLIYVLTRRARIIPRLNRVDPILEDGIAILDKDGSLLRQFSVLESFENSEFFAVLGKMRRKGDIFHTNTLQVFDGSLSNLSPLFGKGNILTSLRKPNVIAIIDPDEGRVKWGHSGSQNGMWRKQHDPRLLENGNMLLFDNLGDEGNSKVVEFDPLTLDVVWQYSGISDGDFLSKTCGTSQRLANGNTLITESDGGRAFETTPDKRIVWEFYNPHRAGEDDELIATLFEVKRVPEDYFPWMGGDLAERDR